MNLREEILREHSKEKCTKIVAWVGDNQQRFDALFQLFLKDEYRLAQRAAWPVSCCVKVHPKLIKKNFVKLINNLQKPALHNAVKRNTVRLLQTVDIPPKLQGQVMDICFKYVAAPHEAVAIKAFSLTVLARLSKQFPEILPEIKLLVQDQLSHATAAFKSRAKIFLEDDFTD